jgi:hypothetical protein
MKKKKDVLFKEEEEEERCLFVGNWRKHGYIGNYTCH